MSFSTYWRPKRFASGDAICSREQHCFMDLLNIREYKIWNKTCVSTTLLRVVLRTTTVSFCFRAYFPSRNFYLLLWVSSKLAAITALLLPLVLRLFFMTGNRNFKNENEWNLILNPIYWTWDSGWFPSECTYDHLKSSSRSLALKE